MILYDNKGLEIFDKITYTSSYYLTNCEIDILNNSGSEILSSFTHGSTFFELGVGAMRKTRYLLQSIVDLKLENVTYYALDLEESSLKSSLDEMAIEFPSITFIGLFGTYSEGLRFIKALPQSSRRCFLWLGSSIGNMHRPEACEFFKEIRDVMQPFDALLCGIDKQNSPEVVQLAYNDPELLSRDFTMNGLAHINHIYSKTVFDQSKFVYFSIYNEKLGRHEGYYKSLETQTIEIDSSSFEIQKNEIINVEYSYKYNSLQVKQLAHDSELQLSCTWNDSSNRYTLQAFQKPMFSFKRMVEFPNRPCKAEFQELSRAWEFVTGLISDLLKKPISLRMPYIFYIGHIPAFSDILLSRHLNRNFIDGKFVEMFERGIDPDLDDLIVKHSHSNELDQWPCLDDLKKYNDAVLLSLFDSVDLEASRRTDRILMYVYEHWAMHLETLIYMITQDSETPVNKYFITRKSRLDCIPDAKLVDIGAGSVTLGINDVENLDHLESTTEIGWDNENPQRIINHSKFSIQDRPVLIFEYLEFYNSGKLESMVPGSWIYNKGWFVKTIFGLVPIQEAMLKPVFVSQFQASAFAEWKNMRLPKEVEIVKLMSLKRIEDPLCLDSNFGFDCWSQRDYIEGGNISVGGDGWEWTASKMERVDGYLASEIYPGYSNDFMEGKHFISIGSSWCTTPRIAMRRSYRNWYQKGYMFAFATFRCCSNK